MTSSGGIALLTRPSVQGRGLANALIGHGLDLKLIVAEAKSPPLGALPRLKELVARTLGHRLTRRLMDWRNPPSPLEMQERQWSERARAAMNESLGTADFPAQVPLLTTHDINSAQVVSALQGCEARLLVVFATSKLLPQVFEAAELGAINGHTSLLPDYKGAFVEFWQLYNEAYDKVGFTIHHIERDLDTGPIVFQKAVPADAADNPFELHARCASALIAAYPQVVADVLSGRSQPFVQGASSTPTYRLKDVTLEKRWELYRRLKSRARSDSGEAKPTRP